MATLTSTEVRDPTKLRLALQEMLFDDVPRDLNPVYTDGEHLYGHIVDDEILLWRLTPRDEEFGDLKFVLLPESELQDRTVLDMLEEAHRDDAWE